MKEYIIIAKSEADIDSLHAELTINTLHNPGDNHHIVPSRSVQVANSRLGNPRITHYMLTDDEAKKLCDDPRVESVHLPAPANTRVKSIIQRSVSYDGVLGNFDRNAATEKHNINWGLRRTSLPAAEPRPGNTYEYDVDGAGVDIVIMDDGIQVDHPELLDVTGVSRVQQIDWYTATGIPGTMPPNHYRCTNYGDGEHGTHVATTAAGKTYGYAKNSRIYSIRIFGNSSQAIADADQFDLIRVWHSKKPVDPKTGFKRPTLVNMSWGYAWYYSNSPFSSRAKITSINYRGSLRNYPTPVNLQLEFGQRPSGIHGMVVPNVDAEQQDAERAGVIFVHSAGNFGHKIDKPGGIDFNNYYTVNGTWGGIVPPGEKIWYHRGGSPSSTNAITVSAARETTTVFNKKMMEVVDSYSERGPGCDVIAPGSNVTAGTSKTTTYSSIDYPWGRNNTTDRGHRIAKISGTSMAAPQVTGVLALYLSQNPSATPAKAKAWIANNGTKGQVYTSLVNNDWANPNALLGGPNNYLYNPYRNKYKDKK